MKQAANIGASVVRRLVAGKRPALDRSFAGRFARRLAKKQRRNWRENGLRPRGRGYDWARQLIPEEILKAAGDNGIAEISAGELARRVGCAVRTVRYYVKRLAAVDQNGRPADPFKCCIRQLAARSGRGAGLRVAVNVTELAGLLKWLRTRKAARFAKSSRQLSLFPEKAMEIPAEIQAQIDRLAAAHRARMSERPASEARAKMQPAAAPAFFSGKGDLFPHTPIISESTPSELPSGSLDRNAARPRVEVARRDPVPRARPDRKWLRQDWLEIQEIDRSEHEPMSERHRRRLMRHLRFACWSRGLDQARTRHVVGAIGWESQRMRKASSRKYLIIDGVSWVLTCSPAELRGATAHFLGMVKVVRGLSSGSDARPPRTGAGNHQATT
jgi:hypothetical protein